MAMNAEMFEEISANGGGRSADGGIETACAECQSYHCCMRFGRLILGLAISAFLAFAQPKTRNIILVTSDGLRWQDLCHGIDPLLAHEKSAGMEKAEELRKRYEKPTEKERREALLPFFWMHLVPRGLMLADVKVTNGYRVSYPGYSEILTGRTEDALIRGNDPIQNPNETVLEYMKTKLRLKREQVALFASWDTFEKIGEHTPGAIFINAGYKKIDDDQLPLSMLLLSQMQFAARTPWDEARHDAFTFELALEYLKAAKPRVLYIALDETDDWAHNRRYDRVLDSIHTLDMYLTRLWTMLQGIPQYRESTTLIVTADHGRGSTLKDWHGHGKDVDGADRIWLAIMGPDTPHTGESNAAAEQRDIAPTMLALMGLAPAGYTGVTGKPIAAALKKP